MFVINHTILFCLNMLHQAALVWCCSLDGRKKPFQQESIGHGEPPCVGHGRALEIKAHFTALFNCSESTLQTGQLQNNLLLEIIVVIFTIIHFPSVLMCVFNSSRSTETQFRKLWLNQLPTEDFELEAFQDDTCTFASV